MHKVVFWIDSVYFGEEGSSVNVIIQRNGYVGNSDNTIGMLSLLAAEQY